jgi:hypothetical protein
MKTVILSVAVVALAGSLASAQVLWDNGPLVTHAGGMSNGADRSAISPGGALFGVGAQQTAGNRVADDFVNDASWTLQSLSLFTYQSFTTTTPTITGVTLQIWGAAGPGVGAPVWGDATTNVLSSVAFSNIYRTTGAVNNNFDRPVMMVEVALPNLQLGAGTFWLDWSYSGTATSGPWQPPVSSASAFITGNALQSVAGAAYNPALDAGASLQVAFPFVINGVPTPGSMAVLGFAGLAASRRRR